MDHDLDTTTETYDAEERSLAAEMGRAVAVSAASVAGMWIGTIAVTAAVGAYQQRKERKAEKAAAKDAKKNK